VISCPKQLLFHRLLVIPIGRNNRPVNSFFGGGLFLLPDTTPAGEERTHIFKGFLAPSSTRLRKITAVNSPFLSHCNNNIAFFLSKTTERELDLYLDLALYNHFFHKAGNFFQNGIEDTKYYRH